MPLTKPLAGFPFSYIGKTKLGKIYRPYGIINVLSRANNKWLPVEVIIDTGTDYTLFPKRYAQILGVDLNVDCQAETTLGVGGTETVYQYKNLPTKIGSLEKKIPVGFLERDDVPPLLGRLGCLETFKLVFENFVSTLHT